MNPATPLSSEAVSEVRSKRKREEEETEEETDVEPSEPASDISNVHGYEDAPLEPIRTDEEEVIGGFLE